jgi:hypothetical protein
MHMEVIESTRPAMGEGNSVISSSPNPLQDESSQPQVNPLAQEDNNATSPNISSFESLLTNHTPVLDSFILQCPTSSLLNLYHTSSYLRSFLESYSLTWRNLSFKLQEANPAPAVSSVSVNAENTQNKSCDYLVQEIVVPFSLHLRSLDLDNTGVSGDVLTTQVLLQRRDTLEHLSVRGCRNVSLKYSILPHLELYARKPTRFKSRNSLFDKKFALKSLYVYRCRHHRRRPYLGSSADKSDSDSYATHKLVLECRRLGIWTDTGWCTTPAGRCQRRRSYANSRLGTGPPEVWVPFDRLWRSRNRIGAVEGSDGEKYNDVCLWDKDEDGYQGEALGTGTSKGEGRMVPVHERRSHRIFIEDVQCSSCQKVIPERCEQCSVLMHCAGCRKTLCYDCAFDKIYRIDEPVPYLPSELWWAPGATQSPNLLKAPEYGGNSSFPRLKMRWCCTEPMFSQGGGITFAVPATDNRKCDRIRAAPLPKRVQWEDDDFISKDNSDPAESLDEGPWSDYKRDRLIRNRLGDLSKKSTPCPRIFCETCYKSPPWKVNCNSCRKPLCNEHDLHGLRLRMCGYRDLTAEKRDLIANLPLEKPRPRIFSVILSEKTGDEKIIEVRFQPQHGGVEKVDPSNQKPQPKIFSIIISRNKAGEEKIVDFKFEEQLASNIIDDIVEFYNNPKNMNEFKEAMQKQLEEANPTQSNSFDSQVSEIPDEVEDNEVDTLPIVDENGLVNEANALRVFRYFPPEDSFIPEEHDLFLTAYTKFPKNFSKIAERFPNKYDVPQCILHYYATKHEVNYKTKQSLMAMKRKGPFHKLNTQWYGCQGLFCPQYRPVNDHRPRCSVAIKECSTCHVYVCPPCRKWNPPCRCAYCSTHYNCPNCYLKLDKDVCRKAAEEEAERLKKLELERKKAELEKQNEEWAAVPEFFERIESEMVADNVKGDESGPENQGPARLGLPFDPVKDAAALNNANGSQDVAAANADMGTDIDALLRFELATASEQLVTLTEMIADAPYSIMPWNLPTPAPMGHTAVDSSSVGSPVQTEAEDGSSAQGASSS